MTSDVPLPCALFPPYVEPALYIRCYLIEFSARIFLPPLQLATIAPFNERPTPPPFDLTNFLDQSPFIPSLGPDFDLTDEVLSDLYSEMQPPGNKDETSTDISLAAMNVLFDQPHTLSEAQRFPPAGPSKYNTHNRSISLGSAPPVSEGAQHPVLSIPSLQHYPDTPMGHTHSPTTSRLSPGSPYQRHSSNSKKRMHDDNSEDEGQSSEMEPPGPNATEEEKKVYKRRLNTRAARRSRKKRVLESQSLREENSKLKTEIAVWKERAYMLERLLATHGIRCPNLSRWGCRLSIIFLINTDIPLSKVRSLGNLTDSDFPTDLTFISALFLSLLLGLHCFTLLYSVVYTRSFVDFARCPILYTRIRGPTYTFLLRRDFQCVVIPFNRYTLQYFYSLNYSGGTLFLFIYLIVEVRRSRPVRTLTSQRIIPTALQLSNHSTHWYQIFTPTLRSIPICRNTYQKIGAQKSAHQSELSMWWSIVTWHIRLSHFIPYSLTRY